MEGGVIGCQRSLVTQLYTYFKSKASSLSSPMKLAGELCSLVTRRNAKKGLLSLLVSSNGFVGARERSGFAEVLTLIGFIWAMPSLSHALFAPSNLNQLTRSQYIWLRREFGVPPEDKMPEAVNSHPTCGGAPGLSIADPLNWPKAGAKLVCPWFLPSRRIQSLGTQ